MNIFSLVREVCESILYFIEEQEEDIDRRYSVYYSHRNWVKNAYGGSYIIIPEQPYYPRPVCDGWRRIDGKLEQEDPLDDIPF